MTRLKVAGIRIDTIFLLDAIIFARSLAPACTYQATKLTPHGSPRQNDPDQIAEDGTCHEVHQDGSLLLSSSLVDKDIFNITKQQEDGCHHQRAL
jgi:hypothetical protein